MRNANPSRYIVYSDLCFAINDRKDFSAMIPRNILDHCLRIKRTIVRRRRVARRFY